MSKMGEFDWDAIEQYYVTRTPASLSMIEFARITESLAETNYTAVNYQLIRDRSKMDGWGEKRAKFLIKKFPGLYTDAEVIYYILRDRLVEGHKELTGTEITQLSRQVREYMEVLLSRDLVFDDQDTGDRVTRDDFIQMIDREMGKPDRNEFAKRAVSVLREENGKSDA